jgi:hypothetical protein
MTLENRSLDTSQPRCHLATTFAQIADHSIFRRITERTLPDTFQAAQQSLILLCTELEKQADWRHYAGSSNHCCVRDMYTQAAFLLKNLSLTQPTQPAPEPAPAPLPDPVPAPQEHSLEAVVETFEAADAPILAALKRKRNETNARAARCPDTSRV